MNVKEELLKRDLPELLRFNSGKIVENVSDWSKRRDEIKELLLDGLWGRKPAWHEKTSFSIVDKEVEAGIVKSRVKALVQVEAGDFSFEFDVFMPEGKTNVPVFVYIAFAPEDNNDDDVTEFLIGEGYGFAKLFYRDIVTDMESDKNIGIGALPQEFKANSWGKVHMWAWGASRIADYFEGLSEADSSRMAVIGHSRLGKAALCAGALDERFSLTISNCSGAGGIAVLRGKEGEMIKNLCGKGSCKWLCDNYTAYAFKESELPFDHHFAAALCAPRHLYVASATNDPWADPPSEFMSAVATTSVYELLGKTGIMAEDTWEKEACDYLEGTIGYHLREGNHYLAQYDWERFVEYRNKHNC